MNVYRASFGRHFCEDRAVGRGVDRGGFPFPGNPPGRIIFSNNYNLCIDYDGRGSPNWLGPLAYYM